MAIEVFFVHFQATEKHIFFIVCITFLIKETFIFQYKLCRIEDYFKLISQAAD
jgi:hypothetical protein